MTKPIVIVMVEPCTIKAPQLKKLSYYPIETAIAPFE